MYLFVNFRMMIGQLTAIRVCEVLSLSGGKNRFEKNNIFWMIEPGSSSISAFWPCLFLPSDVEK